jgi:hypothetical protein
MFGQGSVRLDFKKHVQQQPGNGLNSLSLGLIF